MLALEINPKNCQIIIQRYLNFTQLKDVKINGKKVNWIDYCEEMQAKQ